MTDNSLFARLVAAIGAVAVAIRHSGDGPRQPAFGTAPAIPEAKAQGTIPTLKMPTAKGWEGNHMPTLPAIGSMPSPVVWCIRAISPFCPMATC